LQLQTAPIADEISETLGDLKLETERIKNQLQDIAKMPEGISKKAATEKIYSRIENLCSEFDDSRFQVIGGVKEMGVIMEDLFGDKFIPRLPLILMLLSIISINQIIFIILLLLLLSFRNIT